MITDPSKKSSFYYDLCHALISANIPLQKLQNDAFKHFLEKYTNRIIPDESTLRKGYVHECYEVTIQKIRTYVENKNIWVSIDESTDAEGRYVANVVIGTLESNHPGKQFLIHTDVLEKVNHTTISKLFDRALHIIWPNGIKHDNVLLFLSDAAPYMVKAGKCIQVFYSKMLHVTCVAHALHRVAEEIRKYFPKVDQLISNGKKIFLKAPSRVNTFKEIAPTIPLPPQPVLTRWGTWLNAAFYYCEHFDTIKNVVTKFDKNDAVSIEYVLDLLSDSELQSNLIYIKSNFGTLPDSIAKLESSKISLADSIKIIEAEKINIQQAPNNIGRQIQNKFNAVFEKNTGYNTMQTISKILDGEDNDLNGLPDDMNINDITYFKYAHITSVEVERSFSIYKTLLSDNRRSFLFENIKKTLIVQCNKFEGKTNL